MHGRARMVAWSVQGARATMTRTTGAKLLILLLPCLCVAAMGCGGRGGDDDDDDSGGSCSAAGQAICAAACECRPGDGCAITDETASASLSFDSEQDCLGLYVTLGCSGGGDPGIDFGACADAMAVAECAGEGEAAGVVGPPECESPEP